MAKAEHQPVEYPEDNSKRPAEAAVMHVAYPDRRDRLAHPENRDVLESRAHPDCQATRANRPRSLASQSHRLRASRAQLVHRDRQGLQDHLEKLVGLVSQDNRVKMHRLVSQVPRDRPGHLASLDSPEPQESPDNLHSRSQLCLDLLESLVMPVPLVLPDHLETRVKTEHQANPVPKDHPDRLGLLAMMVNPALLVNLDNPGGRARRAFAPNTVPSMGAFSLRTAHDVVEKKLKWNAYKQSEVR